MTASNPPSIPDETYEELVHATLAALSKKGYVDLRVRDIDAEFEKSRQLIHHYFAGKDELVTETLSVLLEAVNNDFDSTADGDPATVLNDEIDRALLGPKGEMEDFWTGEFWMVTTALYELQSQAQHNPDHQEIFIRFTDGLIEHIREIIQEGIDQGVFDDVDARRMATAIDDLITGAQMKKIHLGDDDALPKRER